MAVRIQDLRGRVIVSCQPVKDGLLDRAEFVVGLALAALNGGAAGAENVFSLAVDPEDEARAALFLQRVKVALEADPGRLVL